MCNNRSRWLGMRAAGFGSRNVIPTRKTRSRWNTTLRDRILIFEDADKDRPVRQTHGVLGRGRPADQHRNRLWRRSTLWPRPTCSFIPDKNGDDVPDGTPEVLLDGFNFKTIGHNVVNGLRWGPGGWLYGRHGITDTSAIGAPGTPADQRTRMNCGIFRWHPINRTFEIVCQGGTNSWGMDWNADGELFWINTVIGHLFHGIPGAYYDRMFGAHLNPHVYELIPQTADHYHWDHDAETRDTIRKGSVSAKTDTLGGGHAHVGCVIYNGGLLARRHQGKIFTCNLHGNRINMDILEREGCGYVGKHGADFMKSKDKWFRGSTQHRPGRKRLCDRLERRRRMPDNDGVHRTSGRIYKIVYEGEPAKLANNWPQRMETLAKSMRGEFPAEPPRRNLRTRRIQTVWSVSISPVLCSAFRFRNVIPSPPPSRPTLKMPRTASNRS